MGEIQRCFADHQHEPAPFFQCDIGGACDQIVGQSMCDARERLHRARRNDHPIGLERPARDCCTDVARVVHAVRQQLECRALEPQFVTHVEPAGAGHYQMALHAIELA
ncbi:hypothetical protein DFQ30_009788 [Apophysomyces sp. BC1015]|nr:hypothetical protein DFQ30_009788 [Apophysomyces sp. BC1015]